MNSDEDRALLFCPFIYATKQNNMKLIQSLRIIKMLTMIAFVFAVVILSGCDNDKDPDARPSVVSNNPISNATDVALNSSISAVFSAKMNASAAGKFTLKQGNLNVAGASVVTGTTSLFTPAAALLPNTLYSVTISKTAQNENGSSMLSDYSWSFTTGDAPDNIKPTIVLTNPVHNATGVAVNQAIVITFSEAMTIGTIDASTFTLKQGTTAITGVVTSTATTATFTPSVVLDANKIYTASIGSGVKDKAGNALLSTQVITFTTAEIQDTVLPTVVTTNPLANATGVARNQPISLTFSEAMDPSTVTNSTVSLKQGSNVISGTVNYADKTATFVSTEMLDAGMTYTATITSGAKDLQGNALQTNTVWSFTTSNNTSTLAVVDLGSAANYVILAKTAINNNPTSAITGDLGLSPAATSYIRGFALTDATGYATSSQVTGNVYAADMASPTSSNLTTAVENMITAYNDAAGRPSPDFVELGTGNIGGKTLTPGLYKWTTTVTLPTDVVISGGANDVWIFQMSGDLTMSSAVNVTLIGGAQAKNIFWQVAGKVTLGTTAHMEGVILSMTGITFESGASLKGRAMAQTAVILDNNIVTKPAN
jgi:methionine-rich copper-binding protein CopC